MDAYCKFEMYGIQVYAGIDAYSRRIMWIYVGISGRTAVSVQAQYLATLTNGRVLPQIITSDRGAETTMAADLHYYLSSQLRMREDREPLRFTDCFRYGTSKQNQRIEAWWGQSSRATGLRWRNYFELLVKEGQYTVDLLPHRISFLAIYIPIIRQELLQFVQTWNSHRIRKQSNRDWVVPGVPDVLYDYPGVTGVHDCGIAVPDDLLTEVQNELASYGECGNKATCECHQC